MLTLCVKVLVPAGYMIGAGDRTFSIEICDGQGGHIVERLAMPRSGTTSGRAAVAKANGVCPYAVLGQAGLAAADLRLPIGAMVFTSAPGGNLAPHWPTRQRDRLHPPQRGPPIPD